MAWGAPHAQPQRQATAPLDTGTWRGIPLPRVAHAQSDHRERLGLGPETRWPLWEVGRDWRSGRPGGTGSPGVAGDAGLGGGAQRASGGNRFGRLLPRLSMSPADGDLSLPGGAEASSLRDLGRLPPKAMRRAPTGQGETREAGPRAGRERAVTSRRGRWAGPEGPPVSFSSPEAPERNRAGSGRRRGGGAAGRGNTPLLRASAAETQKSGRSQGQGCREACRRKPPEAGRCWGLRSRWAAVRGAD